MKIKALLLAAAITLSASAQAKIFDVTWSGAQFGNGATATGKFDINTAVYPQIGSEIVLPFSSDFKLLNVTIVGSAGGGSFGQSDFVSFVFEANSALDYNHELIGQVMDNDDTFGSFGAGYGGPSGDFNLFATNGLAPNGTFYFALTTSSGDTLAVTSIKPGSSVPEPASWALMVAGFGLVGAAVRRRPPVTVAA